MFDSLFPSILFFFDLLVVESFKNQNDAIYYSSLVVFRPKSAEELDFTSSHHIFQHERETNLSFNKMRLSFISINTEIPVLSGTAESHAGWVVLPFIFCGKNIELLAVCRISIF